jgi:tRNA-specific 2-thiouridylase
VRIEPATRRVVLGLREDLAVKSIAVHDINWLAEVPGSEFECDVKVRYRQQAERCRVVCGADGRATVIPLQPLFQVAPGQAAVFYDSDRVLGGGWICSP